LQNEHDRYAEKRRKVYEFLRIPLELEKFVFVGLRQCLDAFCHMFTFLPLRIIVCGVIKILTTILSAAQLVRMCFKDENVDGSR
jgi:hypothetical protein